MVRRWTLDVRVEWKPSLSFSMRKIALAEWLDERVEPVALLDEPERIGVAIGDQDCRVSIRRQSMAISSGALGGSFSQLQTVVDGVFEVLQPRDAVLTRASTLCTEVIGDHAYDDATGIFARHMAGTSSTLAGLAVKDGSGLMDLASPEHDVQVEWGVVNDAELLVRLANPQLGRVQESIRSTAVDEASLRARWRSELPRVALLADVIHLRRRGGKVSNTSDVLHLSEDLARSAEEVTQALHDGLWPRRRTERELA